MPKENTHLFFAERVKRSENGSVGRVIRDNKKYFWLGAVAPDIFYYAKNPIEYKISEKLHGIKGEPTNEIVFEILESAEGAHSEENLAFVLGYLTHLALDQIFHPVVIYLTGNICSSDVKKKSQANFAHRLWETRLDEMVNGRFFFQDLIKPELLRSMEFSRLIEAQFKLKKYKVTEVAKRQARINYLMRMRWVYYFLSALCRTGLYRKKEDLGLYYQQAKNYESLISEPIYYRDLINGEVAETTLEKLFSQAEEKARSMMAAARHYFNGQLIRKQAEKEISGRSLATGRVDCPISAVKYFKNDLDV